MLMQNTVNHGRKHCDRCQRRNRCQNGTAANAAIVTGTFTEKETDRCS